MTTARCTSFNGNNTLAIVSVPRLGFNDAWGAIYNALAPHNICARQVTGPYWEQCLEVGMEWACDAPYDLIIVMDYDTLFTAAHINRMLAIMEHCENFDAVAALQPKRTNGNGLFSPYDADNGEQTVTLQGLAPFRAKSAHFGLTALKTSGLKNMSRPWLHSQPGTNGRWSSEDKLDADMSFWRNWDAAGNTLYIDPQIRVGHLALMVSEFDDKLQHKYITVDAWKSKSNMKTTQLNKLAEALA